MSNEATPRIAIAALRIEIRGGNDERDMVELAAALGYELRGPLVAIDPDVAGPLVTVTNAIRAAGAEAVIVPNLAHLDGIERYVSERALIVTVEGERAMQRARVA